MKTQVSKRSKPLGDTLEIEEEAEESSSDDVQNNGEESDSIPENKNGTQRVVTFPSERTLRLQEVKRQLKRRKEMKDAGVKKDSNWEKLGLVKPDYALDREKERRLTRLATSGVTQLFNAIASRQQFLDSTLTSLKGKGRKERKKTLEKLKDYDFQQRLATSAAGKPKLEVKKEEEDNGYDAVMTNITGGRGKKLGLAEDDGVKEEVRSQESSDGGEGGSSDDDVMFDE